MTLLLTNRTLVV